MSVIPGTIAVPGRGLPQPVVLYKTQEASSGALRRLEYGRCTIQYRRKLGSTMTAAGAMVEPPSPGRSLVLGNPDDVQLIRPNPQGCGRRSRSTSRHLAGQQHSTVQPGQAVRRHRVQDPHNLRCRLQARQRERPRPVLGQCGLEVQPETRRK